MSMRNMQGTPAHIEYIYDKNKIKGHSCKICEYYFDGVCKVKKIALYDYKHARYCGSYCIKAEYKGSIKKKTSSVSKKKEEIPQLKSFKIKADKNTGRKTICAYYGNIVVLKDTKTGEIFNLPPLEKEPKSVQSRELVKAFLGVIIGALIEYNGCTYEVIKIKKQNDKNILK